MHSKLQKSTKGRMKYFQDLRYSHDTMRFRLYNNIIELDPGIFQRGMGGGGYNATGSID